MHLSTVFLFLLGSGVAAFQRKDPADINQPFFGQQFPAELTGTPHAQYPRQKRAFSTFAQAWQALLRTTIGYRRINTLGIERKFFAKVGTKEQAEKDFLSLGPKNVKQTAYGYEGHVGNEIIELHTRDIKIPKTLLYVIPGDDGKLGLGFQSFSKTTREIYYFEKAEDVKTVWSGLFTLW